MYVYVYYLTVAGGDGGRECVTSEGECEDVLAVPLILISSTMIARDGIVKPNSCL